MIIAGTGHRPDKLGGYDPEVLKKLVNFADAWVKEHRPDKIISGMALGWDQALAAAAAKEKIPLIAAIPFEGQDRFWPKAQRQAYNFYIDLAEKVVIVCEGGFGRWKFQRRNEWMVDNCDQVLALWNGSSGGTANCIGYAKRRKKPIINLWDEYNEKVS